MSENPRAHRIDDQGNMSESLRHGRISRFRVVLYSVIPVVVLFLLVEIGLRMVYYQRNGPYRLATIHGFVAVRNKVAALAQEKKAKATQPELPPRFWSEIYGDDGKELFEYLKSQYEHHFTRLVQAAAKLDTRLAVLYIPSVPVCLDSRLLAMHRSYYGGLADKHRVAFIDMTEDFGKFPLDTVTLLPENGHLSRFGNKQVAERVLRFVRQHSGHRIPDAAGAGYGLFGDLKPNTSEIWEFTPAMPYKVVVNSQGLRDAADVEFPKRKQRVVCLGDSFTFGPYLPNHDTYPGLLQKLAPDTEVLNAGVCGYTISDEADLFIERAANSAPDFTILQVHDNDLTGFLYFRQRQFSRARISPEPTQLESAFINKLWNRPRSVNDQGRSDEDGAAGLER